MPPALAYAPAAEIDLPRPICWPPIRRTPPGSGCAGSTSVPRPPGRSCAAGRTRRPGRLSRWRPGWRCRRATRPFLMFLMLGGHLRPGYDYLLRRKLPSFWRELPHGPMAADLDRFLAAAAELGFTERTRVAVGSPGRRAGC